jgi:hypothetical protein
MSDVVAFLGFGSLFFGTLAVADLVVRVVLMLARERPRVLA